MSLSHLKFPLIDAILQLPDEGKDGVIGICTNSASPGQVLNELEDKHRKHIVALGPLIVNRDGTERMIVNTLVHPTLKYLILFGEEGLTFSPSTNLLQVILKGYSDEKKGNYIKDGLAASPHYPNISNELLDIFRKEIIVLPLFTFKSAFSTNVLKEYMTWLHERISPALFEKIKKIVGKDKIYYDVLKDVIENIVTNEKNLQKNAISLDVKQFQHLQPPRLEITGEEKAFSVPFKISNKGKILRVDLQLGNESFFIQGEDDFLIGYSLMKQLQDKKSLLSPLDQILLGAELGLMRTKVANDLDFPSLTKPDGDITGTNEILLEPRVILVTDKQYYYRVGLSNEQMSVMCMAYDVCEEVFDLRSAHFAPLIEKIASLNRFEVYEMDILHRIDIGTQIARAYIALKMGYSFMQDFSSLFKLNTTELPLVIADEDNFLAVHKSLLQQVYISGLTEEHGDSWKGLARTAITLAIFRQADKALGTLPILYKLGDQSTEEMRAAYKAQLLRFDHDGSYSYGERTRTFFGFDQLPKAAQILKENPKRAVIIQRFDPSCDMGTYTNPDTGKLEFTHDPCLSHDIYFIRNNKLFGFHIARAHNLVNAYPENIFGLFDAYSAFLADSLNIPHGDEFMLSSRANILLLTEEQRTRKILAEPSKPSYDIDSSIGPYLVGENIKDPPLTGAIAYYKVRATKETTEPDHLFWERLTHYQGQDTVKKAVTYLKEKGIMHNNPILSGFHTKTDHPQNDTLVFFQANVFGKRVHGTAVFANRSLDNIEKDRQMLNYLLTQYSETLDFPLGDLTTFYVNY